jgi:exodeoxyribonuclease V alpha subunit
MENIDTMLTRLATSKFRLSLRLKSRDIEYIQEKGICTIRRHASDFVKQRLAPKTISNDGKQTPMHGHPVFIAQHACACCCRKCLNKWYGIPEGIELDSSEQTYIIDVLMTWIKLQLKSNNS